MLISEILIYALGEVYIHIYWLETVMALQIRFPVDLSDDEQWDERREWRCEAQYKAVSAADLREHGCPDCPIPLINARPDIDQYVLTAEIIA